MIQGIVSRNHLLIIAYFLAGECVVEEFGCFTDNLKSRQIYRITEYVKESKPALYQAIVTEFDNAVPCESCHCILVCGSYRRTSSLYIVTSSLIYY